MQRCELAEECCVCSVPRCPWDEAEKAYLMGVIEDEDVPEYAHRLIDAEAQN